MVEVITFYDNDKNLLLATACSGDWLGFLIGNILF